MSARRVYISPSAYVFSPASPSCNPMATRPSRPSGASCESRSRPRRGFYLTMSCSLPDLVQGSQPQRRMMSSVPELSSSYSHQVSSSYRLDPSESVVSSRSNSRPSTANSLPPSRYPNIMQPVDVRSSWGHHDEYGQSYGVRYQQ